MTIANELSSDIAIALVAAKEKQPGELDKLNEILLEVHKTLQELTEKTRTARARTNSQQARGN